MSKNPRLLKDLNILFTKNTITRFVQHLDQEIMKLQNKNKKVLNLEKEFRVKQSILFQDLVPMSKSLLLSKVLSSRLAQSESYEKKEHLVLATTS